MLTLTYGGSTRVMPNYNVMGVAKAALEASVRYLAVDFGDRNIRVNAISAGPVRTLAGSGVSDARLMFNYQSKQLAAAPDASSIEEIGNTALYLLSDLGSAVTGEIHFVDAGYNIVSMPRLDELKELDTTERRRNAGRRERADAVQVCSRVGTLRFAHPTKLSPRLQDRRIGAERRGDAALRLVVGRADQLRVAPGARS